jgi:hypothetical protein
LLRYHERSNGVEGGDESKGVGQSKGRGGASSLADTVNKGVADRDLRAQERQDKKLCAATPECVLEEDEEVQVPATQEQQPPVSAAPARLAGA